MANDDSGDQCDLRSHIQVSSSQQYLFVFKEKYTRPERSRTAHTHTHTRALHRITVRNVVRVCVRDHKKRWSTEKNISVWNFIDRQKINFNINYLTI